MVLLSIRKRPFPPELPGQKRSLLKFGTSFRREGKPQGCRGPLSKFGIEKDVERRNLAIANNDDIQSGVVWGLAFRA